MFDVNDFDETLPGPWEWDVKRLAVSMLIAARANGYRVKDQERIVLDTVNQYRTAMANFAGMKNLDVWYSHLDIEQVLKEYAPQFKAKMVKRADKKLAKARTKDSMAAFSKLINVADGQARIVDQSPLIVPIDKLAEGVGRDEMFEQLHELMRLYRETLGVDRRVLLEQFDLTDFARKVVGCGQRRYARVDRAAARPRRPGPAVPADEGGRGVGARGVPRSRASSRTTASEWSTASG